MPTPSAEVEAAFIGPATQHVRRVDIYEADGKTVWMRDVPFTDGSVSVDYGRDERRSIEITFDNTDGALDYDPSGFWYDKIIKPYRGVEYQAQVTTQEVVATNRIWNTSGKSGNTNNFAINGAIGSISIEADDTFRIDQIADGTLSVGPHANTGASDGIPAVTGDTFTVKFRYKGPGGTVIFHWRDDANAIIAQGTQALPNTPANWSWIEFTATVPAVAGITNASFRTFIYRPGGLAGEVHWLDRLLLLEKNADPTTPYFDGSMDAAQWTGAAYASSSELIRTTTSYETRIWETQVGEYMIDRIQEPHFPDIIKVSGRDYTKRMLLSKFAAATGFNAGASLDATINSIASNAGIDAQKRLIPVTGQTLGRDFIWERGVTRWQACKDLAEAYGYELFFDAEGFLVMREYNDPTTSPLVYTFETGEYGNLVNYEKSVNDTRLYNHIVVSGGSSDTIPVWAEASNTNPSSPTNINLIGDRLYEYTSEFITTTAQAQDVANKFLSIHSLQEFEVNYASLMLPWLEVGEIIEFIDPKRTVTQPDRLLLTTLTIPLGLGPMSGTGKRVTVVG